MSLNAITDTVTPNTMRLLGRIGEVNVVILVNSSSTQNFLYINITHKSSLLIQMESPLLVKITSGVSIGVKGTIRI